MKNEEHLEHDARNPHQIKILVTSTFIIKHIVITISNMIIIIENKITNMTKIKIKDSTKLKIAIINTNTTIITVMMMIGRTEMNIDEDEIQNQDQDEREDEDQDSDPEKTIKQSD